MLFFKKKLTKTAQVLSLVLASTTAGFSYADTAASCSHNTSIECAVMVSQRCDAGRL